ncbi:MAG: hypothetical protein FJ291_09375 [Planctomycetes bacterium]|nr:hypothetical protein [Planctomycetota bacterium]
MARLYIRDVPPSLHHELRRLAAEHKRSISAEVIELLAQELAIRRKRAEVSKTLAGIKRTRFTLPPGSPTTDEMLREDRAR